MKRKTARRLILIPLVSLFVLLGLLVGSAALLLTPQRLTPLVTGLCDRYLDAQVRFDTVSVSLFQDFPYITLRLRGTEVVSHAFRSLPDSVRQTLPAEADTLVRAGRLDVSLNAWGLLSGRADIRRIGLADTHLHAYVAPGGVANWEIYRSDTTAVADTVSSDFEININRFSIRDGLHLVYDSRPDSVSASVRIDSFSVRGRLTTNLLQNDIQRLRLVGCAVQADLGGQQSGVVIDSLTVDGRRRVDYTVNLSAHDVDWDGHRWLDSLRFQSGLLFHGKDHKELSINGFDLRLNDMGVTAGGEVGFLGDSIAADLRVQTAGLRLADMMRVIPTDILPLARDYETDLTTDLDLRISGGFNPVTGSLPDMTADWRIPGGYLYYTKGKYGSRIDTLALDATFRFRPHDPDSTGVDLRRLKLSGIGLSLDASGRVDRLSGDASFSGDLRGDLSLDYLAQHFPSPDGTSIRGRIGIDLKGQARLSQLTPARIGAAKLGGHLRMDTLLVDIPKQDFHLMVGHGRLGVGTGLSASDTLIAKGTQAVGATLTLDTVDMDIGRQLCVTGRQIKVHATTATRNLVRDTTAIHPSQGILSAVGLRIDLGDSTVFIGRGIDSRWSILPSPLSQSVPQLALDIKARRLSMREGGSRFALRQGSVRIDATLYQPDSTATRRRTARLDSLQRIYPAVPRDSLMAHVRALRGPAASKRQTADDAFAENDIDLRLSSDLGKLLRQWQVSGSVAAASGRVVTPCFPLATTLRDIDITFNTDEVHLNRTFIKAGESQMVLTGGISGLRRALLGGGTVRGSLKVDADTLNLNEIIRVANAGASLVAQGGVSQTGSDDQMEHRIAESADTTAASSVLVVPGNIDVTFDLTVHHGAYANLRLDSLAGEVQARNRALRLSDLTMRSSAGDIKMTGLYSTRTPQDIQAGFDVEMENMKMARLIELVPSFDTLMPMLRSFDGVVNCQIAVTGQLDSAMNIRLPSLNAACRIVGDSLVLMDGEIFSEISKMLMFKNKERNVIDHISAEMLVRDSQIEIFPFVVEIDRYRAAVSGVHKMDMSFNYHISVLKSPIPFRLGVDIFGNLDDFDFKIGRARYKSAELPSRVELIDSTRLNLRNYIRDAFLRGARVGDISSLRITPSASSPDAMLPPADSLSEEEKAHIAADSTLRQKL